MQLSRTSWESLYEEFLPSLEDSLSTDVRTGDGYKPSTILYANEQPVHSCSNSGPTRVEQ